MEVEHRMIGKVEERLGMGNTEGMIKLSPLDIAEVMGHASMVEFLRGEKISVPNPHDFFSMHVGEYSGVGETSFSPRIEK